MAHSRYSPVILRLAILLAILAPVGTAQKPPSPPPTPPPSAPSSGPTNFPIRGTNPIDSTDQFVLFLRGRVATNDSTPIPNDMVVERVCNNKVRQQAYAASRGDFSMQLGSTTDAFLDATAEPTWQTGVAGKDSTMGIPRRELNNCEIRARAPGFRDGVINLDGLDMTASNIDVGVIVVVRSIKTKGATLSATPYMAPKEARKAYENGLAAEKKSNLPGARKYFEAAVAIYPTMRAPGINWATFCKRKTKRIPPGRRLRRPQTSINDSCHRIFRWRRWPMKTRIGTRFWRLRTTSWLSIH